MDINLIILGEKVLNHTPTKDYLSVAFANDIDTNLRNLLSYIQSQPGTPGTPGKSAFELWQAIPGNENKTLLDFYTYLSQLATGSFSTDLSETIGMGLTLTKKLGNYSECNAYRLNLTCTTEAGLEGYYTVEIFIKSNGTSEPLVNFIGDDLSLNFSAAISHTETNTVNVSIQNLNSNTVTIKGKIISNLK